MEQYLASLQENLKDLNQFSSVHVVVGNESCDLDSAVSAVTYAYYLSQIRKEKTTLVVPVLNIAASQYHIHTEIVHVFKKKGIHLEHLVFLDQLDFNTLASSGQLKLTLVDHNVPTGQLSSLDGAVVSVIDHHVRECPENDKVTVKLDVVGSCCTLVAEELLNDPDFKIDETVAELLLGTILIDTVNRLPEAGKITPRDTAILERLQDVMPEVNSDRLYAEIQAAKLDMSGLSNMEILEKDLKMVSGTAMTIAMSSVGMDIQELLDKPGFQSDLEKFCSNKMADVAIVMTMTTDVEGQPARQMAVFSTNRIYRDQIADVLDNSVDLDLDLEPVMTTFENISVFHQGNISASRKLVMPVLGSFLHGDRSPEAPNKELLSDSSVSMETEGFTSFSNIIDQDIPDGPESYETSLDSATNKTVTNLDFLNSDNDSFCQSFGAQVIEEDSKEPLSNTYVKEENQTLPSGEKSSANSSNLFDFLTSGSSELMDPFSSIDENTSAIENSPKRVEKHEQLANTESPSSAITTDTSSSDPFNILSSDSNELNTDDTQINLQQADFPDGNQLVSDLAEFDLIQSSNTDSNADASNSEETNTHDDKIFNGIEDFDQKQSSNSDSNVDFSNLAEMNTQQTDDPFGIFNDNVAEPTNSNNNPFTIEQSNSNPFETNDSVMKAFSTDQDPFGSNDAFNTNQDPFGFNENFTNLTSQSLDLETGSQNEGTQGNLSSTNPFGQNFTNILTPYNSTDDADGSSNSSTNPFQLNVSVVEPDNIFPDPFGSLQRENSPILELPESPSENGYLSTGREGGARARKSISLIVEVDKESEGLGDLDESDFYDRVPSPERDRSGSDSPYINPNFTSPFGRYRTRTSDSSSGFPSVTTPPNSVIETSLDSAPNNHDLPSFNSAEMVERIRKKKQGLHGGEDLLGSDMVLMSTPYTPQNSFRDDFERRSHDLDLLTLDNESMSARIQEKRDSLGVFSPVDIPQSDIGDVLNASKTNSSALLDFGDIPDDSGELTVASYPDVPSNSFVGTPGDFMHKNALEGFELQDKLAQLQDTQDKDDNDDDLVMLDFSTKVSNDTDQAENKLHEQNNSQILFDMDTLNESGEQLENKDANNTNGSLLDFEENKSTQISELEKSANDIAKKSVTTELTHEIIHEAVEKFPDMENPALAECVAVEVLAEDNSMLLEQGSEDSENDSNQSVPPRSPRSPRRVFNSMNKLNVETEYLPSMDPLHGNLNIVTSPSSPSQTIETDADKEVVESESFRRVSGQEPEATSDFYLETFLDSGLDEQGRELWPGPQPPARDVSTERETDILNMIMEENLLTSRPSTGYLPDQENEKAEIGSSADPPVDLFDRDIEKDSESMVDSSPENSSAIETQSDNIIDITNHLPTDNTNSDKQSIDAKELQANESELVSFKEDNLETDLEENLDIENGNLERNEVITKDVIHSMDGTQDNSVAMETVSSGNTPSIDHMSGFFEVNPEFREAAEACNDKYDDKEDENATVGVTEETEASDFVDMLPTVQESVEDIETSVKDSRVTVTKEVTVSENASESVPETIEITGADELPENTETNEKETIVSSSDTLNTGLKPVVNSSENETTTVNVTDDKNSTVLDIKAVTITDNEAVTMPQTIEITGVDGVTATVVGSGETNSISPDSSSSFISTSDSESELITVRENLVTENAKSVPSTVTIKCEDYDDLQHKKDESNTMDDSNSHDQNISAGVVKGSPFKSDDIGKKIEKGMVSSDKSIIRESEDLDQNTYTSYDISIVDDILPNYGESPYHINLSSIVEENDTFLENTVSLTDASNDIPKEDTHNLIDVSMTESAVTIETISPVETPNDEHATGFYEVNPETRESFDLPVSDMIESQYDTNLGENVTGFYEINPDGNDLMMQSTETTESISPAVTPSDEHATGFYEMTSQNDTKENDENISLSSFSEKRINMKETVDSAAGDEKNAPEINVDDFDSQDSEESNDSSDDGETGFYDMNAKIQGTMLQNIEIGNSFSPMESPNDEIIDINPMVQDNDTERSNDLAIHSNENKGYKISDSEEKLVELADAMVTDAITGALDTVQEMHIEKNESFIVSEIANAMVDDDDNNIDINSKLDASSTSMVHDINVQENHSDDAKATPDVDVHKSVNTMDNVDNDDSSDSDTSSTTTEGSYRIPHSLDDSPVMSPENESYLKKQNGALSPLIEPIASQSNTQLSSNDEGFVHDIEEGRLSSEVFEEVVDDNHDSIKIKDKEALLADVNKGNQDTVFAEKVFELEQPVNIVDEEKESIFKSTDSDNDVANGNVIQNEHTAVDIKATSEKYEKVKVVGNVFSFDNAADFDVDTDNFTKIEDVADEGNEHNNESEKENIRNSNVAQLSELKQEILSNEIDIDVDKTQTIVNDNFVDALKQDVCESNISESKLIEDVENKSESADEETEKQVNDENKKVTNNGVNVEIEPKETEKHIVSEVKTTTDGDVDRELGDSSEYVTRREIFYTSAGRMSISIDTVVDKKATDEQEVTSQDIIHEAVEIPAIGPILARAESVVGHVDDMLNEETIAHLQHVHNMHKSSCTDFDTLSLFSQPPDDDDDEDGEDVKPVEEVKPSEPQPTVKPQPQSNSHGKMKAMEDTQEWHEDPIPGMAAQEEESESESDSDTDSEYTKPVRPDSLPGNKRKKKIAANSNMIRNDSTDDLVEGVDDLPTPDDLETPDDMEGEELEWEDDTPITPIDSKKFTEYRQVDEDDEDDKDQQENGQYTKVEIAGKDYRVDMHVIEPYKKVLSHGGYYGDGLNAIILFCGCYLPDRSRRDYQYVMDNLFLYVISTLELLVAEDYMIVYFHGATPRRQMPSFGWLKRCYQMIDRRLRKNLKALLMVHPTLWLKTVVMMTKPFISSKFSSKLRFVKTLQELGKIVPMEYIYVPDPVTQYDTRLKQHRTSSSSSTPISPTSPS